MNERWTRSKTVVYNLGYHLIWSPKYRRKVLVGLVAERLEELLLEKSKSIGVDLKIVAIQSDHLHLFVKTDPTDSPHWVVQQLKGYTSRILRQEFPELKSKIPSLWTRSYYCESVGHISNNIIARYIEEQKYH
jgi:putative transposase